MQNLIVKREMTERLKKKKYIQLCFNQRHYVTPFVVSVDGLVDKEARTIINTLADKQAHERGKSHPHLSGFLRARLSILMLRASHMCLR
jgi:hypothetical protein